MSKKQSLLIPKKLQSMPSSAQLLQAIKNANASDSKHKEKDEGKKKNEEGEKKSSKSEKKHKDKDEGKKKNEEGEVKSEKVEKKKKSEDKATKTETKAIEPAKPEVKTVEPQKTELKVVEQKVELKVQSEQMKNKEPIKNEEQLKNEIQSFLNDQKKNEEELRNEINILLEEKSQNEEVMKNAESMIELLDAELRDKEGEIVRLNETINKQKEEKIMLLNNINELTLTIKSLEETISVLKIQLDEKDTKAEIANHHPVDVNADGRDFLPPDRVEKIEKMQDIDDVEVKSDVDESFDTRSSVLMTQERSETSLVMNETFTTSEFQLPAEVWLPYALGVVLKENAILRKRLGELIVCTCGLNRPLSTVTQSMDGRMPLYLSSSIVSHVSGLRGDGSEEEMDEEDLDNQTPLNTHHQTLLNILKRANDLKRETKYIESCITIPPLGMTNNKDKEEATKASSSSEISVKDNRTKVLVLEKELERIEKETTDLKEQNAKAGK